MPHQRRLLRRRLGGVELDADQAADAGLLHGDAVQCFRGFHGLLGMGDDHELGIDRHLGDEAGEAGDVGLIERGIDLIQHAERAGLIVEYGHEQGDGGQRLLAAGEQEDVLQALAGRRADDIDAAIGDVLLVGEAHLAGAAAEQRLEPDAEVGVDGFEGLGEFLAGNQVDFLNRLLGVADGIDQVLTLGAEEIVALLGLLILLHGGGVDGAETFDTVAHLVGRLLGIGHGVAIGDGVVGGGEVLHGAAQFLAAGFVEVLQLGLFAHQIDLDLGALLLHFVDRGAQSFKVFFVGAQGFAHGGIFGRHLVDLGFDGSDLLGQERTFLIEFDVVGQESRAMFAEAGDFGRDGVAAVGGLVELLLQAAHGGALAAVALFEACQLGADHGVLLDDGGRLAFELLQFGALVFQRLLALRTETFLLRDGAGVALALIGRFFGVAAQALQLQAGHADARIGARQIVAQLAHFMIQRDTVLFARLLQGAQALQLGLEAGDLLGEAVEPNQHFIEGGLPRLERYRQFAGFAFHGERPGAALLAAGDGQAVIAGAIGEQEVEVRIADGEALGGDAVFGQETQGDARHKVDGSVLESVGKAEGIAEAGTDAGLGPDGGLGQTAAGVAIGFRVDQEGGASLQLGADEIEAALGLRPVLDDDVLELLVEELFRRLFELRVDFDVVGEDAEGLQVVRLALFERGEESLDALGGVGAMGEHLFERFLAAANVADLGLDAVELAAQFGGEAAAVGEVLLGALALAGDGFELHLPLGDGLGKLLAGEIEAGDFGGGDGFFAGGAGGLTVDAGEVLFDLRQLVLEGGRLAQEAEDHLPAAFDGALSLADFELKRLTLLVD